MPSSTLSSKICPSNFKIEARDDDDEVMSDDDDDDDDGDDDAFTICSYRSRIDAVN